MIDRAQVRLIGTAAAVAVLVALHPPWRATGVRTVTRFASAPGVEPATIVDTVEWALPFAPVYARPRAPARPAASRVLSPGDSRYRSDMAEFERRYKVPEMLRSAGAAWRDSILGRAGIPSGTVYEASFSVDGGRLALRLAMLALVTASGAYWLRRRRRRDPEWDQEDDIAGT